jgi:hypothetical protein
MPRLSPSQSDLRTQALSSWRGPKVGLLRPLPGRPILSVGCAPTDLCLFNKDFADAEMA